MAENVCVNNILFEQHAKLYAKAYKDKHIKGNSILEINEKDMPKGIDKDKLWKYTPYMKDLRENIFRTIFAKVEELLTKRPNTPIALLATDKGTGHYVIVKGTTNDGRFIVMNPADAKVEKYSETEKMKEMIWDVDNVFANTKEFPVFSLTWLERFDSQKAKEIENKCDMQGAYYNKNGELMDSERAEIGNLLIHQDWLMHKNGVSLKVLDQYKGDSGSLYRQDIYVPKTFNVHK